MCALSAYDQPCEDDERQNRLAECLSLFNSIANHKLFEMTSFILFLNKIDIFQRKLESGSLLHDHFPSYKGDNDYASATDFIHEEFLGQCKDTSKQVYVHFTHATVSDFVCSLLSLSLSLPICALSFFLPLLLRSDGCRKETCGDTRGQRNKREFFFALSHVACPTMTTQTLRLFPYRYKSQLLTCNPSYLLLFSCYRILSRCG